MTAQELLRSDSHVREAFHAHYRALGQTDITRLIAALSKPIWASFCRSPQAKALTIDCTAFPVGVNLPAAAVSDRPPKPARQTAADQLIAVVEAMNSKETCMGTARQTAADQLIAETVALGVVTSQTPEESAATGERIASEFARPGVPSPRQTSAERTCAGCGATVPSERMHGLLCRSCATPSPVVTSPEPAVSQAEQGLLTMLAQGLKSIGFAPDQAVSAQRCEAIAFEQAQAVVEMVLEDWQAHGKLGTQRQVIEVRETGKPPVQVEGETPVWFPRLVKLAACGIPALLVGPAGSGKTTAAATLAKIRGVPFCRISMAAGTDEGQLQGWLHPKEQMHFKYVASMLSHAYEAEEGGLVLLDDMDLADANMLGIANAVLDDGGWFVSLRAEKPYFEKSPKFYLMACANTYGHGADRQYVGANQLDERTLSRFRAGQIKCDYDESMETALYGNHRAGAAESLVFGHRLRKRLRALPGTHRDVSTRDIAKRYQMLAQFSVSEAWYGQFCDWSHDECQQVHCLVDHVAMTVEME